MSQDNLRIIRVEYTYNQHDGEAPNRDVIDCGATTAAEVYGDVQSRILIHGIPPQHTTLEKNGEDVYTYGRRKPPPTIRWHVHEGIPKETFLEVGYGLHGEVGVTVASYDTFTLNMARRYGLKGTLHWIAVNVNVIPDEKPSIPVSAVAAVASDEIALYQLRFA